MTDNEIIKRILHGNTEMFRILVERYQQMVFRTSIGFIHNKDDADDLTQDIFIKAYQSLPDFKGDAAFSTWLYRITVNASLNKVRRPAYKLIFHRFDNISGDNGVTKISDYASNEDNPEDILIRHEHIEWIQKALDALPENQRTAIVLSKYDDLSQKEIAEIMGVSEGAIEALLQRAKKNLRKKMSVYRKNM